MSLRWRLGLAVLLITGFGFYLIVSRTVNNLRPRYQEALEETMVDTATILASWVSHGPQKDPAGDRPDIAALAIVMDAAKRRAFSAQIYTLTKTSVAMDVRVTDAHGIVLFDSVNPANIGKDFSRWNDVARTLHGRYGARATRTDPSDPRTAILHVAAPILNGDRVIGVLTVIKQVDDVSIFFAAARTNLLLGGVVIAIAAVTVAMVVTWWITRPIQLLIRHVQAVKAGGRPPPPRLGRHELGELGTAFTGLREAIDGRAYIERYVQTLTHEMKSPLSAIRGAAELLNEDLPAAERERFLRNIQAETGRLQSLVDMLLQLAALECRANDVEPVDVHPAGLIQDVLDSLRPLLVARHLDVSISCEPQVILHGELFLLRQALSNLVQNAIDFSPVSGRIEIQLSSDHGFTELRVLDRGAGIPDFARGRIFERFYSLPRPDSGRKGSGLGLNLVREVALVHGGTVLLTDRNGGGTVATLRLPVADVVPTSDSPS